MAEICVESSEAAPRNDRRRRLDIPRTKFVADAEAMASCDELRRKQRKLGKVDAENEKLSDGESVLNSVTGLDLRSGPVPIRYGVTSVCGRRRDMEDAVSIQLNFLKNSETKNDFFGVFDGHGCSHVAALCKERMHEIIAISIEKMVPSKSSDWKEVMEKSFACMDSEVADNPNRTRVPNCRCELQTPKCDHVGSTAVVAVVSSNHIIVSNCGDSRAVIARAGGAAPLSFDHKPDRPDELKRIQEAGGRVIYWDGARVLGVLAMSRAIGDNYLKPFVISEPEVTVTERTDEDECLILASDGLWDVISNETACSIARMCLKGSASGAGRESSNKACSDAATLLTKMALARHSADNVSVVVVDLRRNL